jgi:hypothetical protein
LNLHHRNPAEVEEDEIGTEAEVVEAAAKR